AQPAAAVARRSRRGSIVTGASNEGRGRALTPHHVRAGVRCGRTDAGVGVPVRCGKREGDGGARVDQWGAWVEKTASRAVSRADWRAPASTGEPGTEPR